MTTAKISFNIENLEKLIYHPSSYEVADIKTPALRIGVYPSKVKTFLLYKKVNGVPQKIKIGRYPDLSIEQAKKEAKRLLALIALGHDIQAEKQEQQAPTFKELYEHYYHEHAIPFTKRPDDNRRTVELHVFPQFGKMKGNDITRKMMRKLHRELGKTHAKATANRIITIISAVFNFCIKNDHFSGTNPCIGVKRFKTTSRDRFLSPEELEKFFKAVNEEEELQRDFVLMALFTGARRSNILSMKWTDIDFANKRWRISESETKNSDVNLVVLPRPALDILSKRQEQNKRSDVPSLFVFPGSGKDGHFKDPKKTFNRIRERMEVYDIRLHDLRRTLGSYMAITGASLPIIGAALNHKSQDSTAIYARLSQAPVHNAVNTAVKTMIGKCIFTRFIENKDFLTIISKGREIISFTDLIAA